MPRIDNYPQDDVRGDTYGGTLIASRPEQIIGQQFIGNRATMPNDG